MQTSTPKAVARIALAFVVALLAGGCAHGRATREKTPPPGASYTVRVTTVSSGEGALAVGLEAQRVAWTGAVITDRARGRLDVVEGAQPSLLQRGDFILFDSTDFIVARPASGTFSVVSSGQPSELKRLTDSVGITTTLSDIVVSLDSLGAGEPIDRRASLRYRLNLSFSMTTDYSRTGIDVGEAVRSKSITTQTTDYWFVRLGGELFPPSYGDFAFRRLDPSGRMSEVWNRVRAARASLPPGMTAVRMNSSTRIVGRYGSRLTMATMEITDVKFVDIDLTRFVLPDGYRETPFPGAWPSSGTTSKDGGARWRRSGVIRIAPPPARR